MQHSKLWILVFTGLVVSPGLMAEETDDVAELETFISGSGGR